MTKETYLKITEPLRRDSVRSARVHKCNKLLTGIVFISYPMLLFYLLWQRNMILAKAVIVPFDSFVLLTVFRYFINAKRPYEVFGIPPVIPKDTRGKSFPSRHVFSVFIIAMTFLATAPVWQIGILFLVIGVLLAVVRVAAGVHFPMDVIAGALTGIFCGILGYWIL